MPRTFIFIYFSNIEDYLNSDVDRSDSSQASDSNSAVSLRKEIID